jgi:hypothetical protein
VQVKKARKQVTTGPPKHSGLPCAIGFNGLNRLAGCGILIPRGIDRSINALDVGVASMCGSCANCVTVV